MENLSKRKTISNIVMVIVILAGSIPGIVTLVSTASGPFQLPEGSIWQRLLIGLISIGIVCIVSLFLVKFLFKRLVKTEKNIKNNSSWICFILFIGILVAFLVGMEFDWLIPKAFGWGGVTGIKWIQFIIHVPLFAVLYSIIPALLFGIIGGLSSYFYLKKTSSTT